MQQVLFQDLGLIKYKQAWDYQEQLFQQVVAQKLRNRDAIPNTQHPTLNHLLFCEHPPVITLGKTGKDTHLLMSEAWLKQKGIDFFHINRGGDITFHGPEQVVGYPIL